MSKVNNNPLVTGSSGGVGRTIYYRTVYGKLQMCNWPAPRKRISEKQVTQSERFKYATQYAKRVTRDPAIKAHYATAIDSKRRSAYNVALSDYMNPPVIHYIRTQAYTGAVGSLITIKATDDFRVEKVMVAIYSADGTLIEKGEAQKNKRKPFMWNYRAAVNNGSVTGCRIEVVAEDQPKNRTLAEVVL